MPRCGAPLTIDRGIEIGHIFQLGRKYADAFGLDVLGADGRPIRVTMGSYGIGVSRAVAAIAEQSHDDKGLVWPGAVAPADVHIVAVGTGEQLPVAERLAGELEEQGTRVLLDDRGITRRGLQGRRAARHPDHRGGRQGPSRTVRSRSRTGVPVSGAPSR